jgi:hypothetical protein
VHHQHHLVQFLSFDGSHHVLDMGAQVNVWGKQMGALAHTGERKRVYAVALGL